MSQVFLRRAAERFALPAPYLSLLDGLAHDTIGHARVGEQLEALFPITSGVPQGCPLSGSLWALAFDPWIR
eukprot:6716150-Pyramimonas_sp.AAC.1